MSEQVWEDYDLSACLEENPKVGITPVDVAAILAVWEGENDGDDWRWIVQLTDGQFAFIQGWCDYTGWDCQSNARAFRADSVDQAIDAALANQGDWVWQLPDEVVTALRDQLTNGKKKTWRETQDDKFGVKSTYVPERDR